ncbi:para-aminobenzoate synthase [Choiromyces venosus 120613-1]|uniref:aminodeoxychorismate synthase n=1 Tax=Choiromyces venosus 120613-1 TaxID=1336337 RepID=A0A3N4JT00_9PEZI|nr:para-aminobenzoate synthase [Choiromyces venosus 120613-1]
MRILLVDAYDSFTQNLAQLLTSATGATVYTIRIDDFPDISFLKPHLPSFDAVVIGPGPGSPEVEADIGVVNDVWKLSGDDVLPVFGVCLGLQSLVFAHGGQVNRLGTVKHGLLSEIVHSGEGLFEGVGKVNAVRYHSLHGIAKIGGDVEEIAWADDENGRVVTGVKHISKPFWGVQYHPESVCTEGGRDVVQNFWKMAMDWNNRQGRVAKELRADWKGQPREKSLMELQTNFEGGKLDNGYKTKVRTKEIFGKGISAGRICEMLGVETADEFVLLESAATPGRYSIIGILTPGLTQRINYSCGDSYLKLSCIGPDSSQTKVDLKDYEGSIWRFLAKYMDQRKATGGKDESLFWGGLVGYFNYETGVTSLDIPIKPRKETEGIKRRPDINLVFVERSIVLDEHTGKIYIQTLLSPAADGNWLETMKRQLQQEADMTITPSATPPPEPYPERNQSSVETSFPKLSPTVYKPDPEKYMQKVKTCQSYLSTGDSYELCLTAATKIHLEPTNPWILYRHLRVRNPAPYASYFRLSNTTLLSSSPERFLSWSRSGTCQLRPIKGTVKKTPTTTYDSASLLLNTPKERAENLMIVDLIRHDLHRLATNVSVEKLMVVEEYASVYQLVSVITGTVDSQDGMTGFDVLARSLPPGSMTGAPKKRSVEILQEIEETERGVYSGVLGYWSVCGAGDWNVIIRSAFRYDDEAVATEDGSEKEVWRVGAGGAVTALSGPKEEWEEMEVKLNSTLRAFVGDF